MVDFVCVGLRVNGYFVCMGLCGKILRRLVGAVPMCPPVSPSRGASVVKISAHNACIFIMETPLRGRSGGHAGTAPTISFGWIVHGTVDVVWGIACGCLMPLGWIARKWYFVCMGLCGKILRRWVGAVPVCPPVSPCRGAFVVHPPHTMRVFLAWKCRCADVRAGTQAPPLRFRLDGLRVGV